MLGLDTNFLVRFLVRDDEAQFESARRLIQREAAASEAEPLRRSTRRR
jgi:predicted nucleic-acid-binding protein